MLILFSLDKRTVAAGALRRLYLHQLLPYPSKGKINFDFENMLFLWKDNETKMKTCKLCIFLLLVALDFDVTDQIRVGLQRIIAEREASSYVIQSKKATCWNAAIKPGCK